MATFQTYQAKGDRESLSDIIKDISPEETPALSNFGTGTATATFQEWQTDVLATANANNAIVEGADSTLPAIVPTVRLGNYVQDAEVSFAITNVQDKVKKAGRKSESAYQVEKAFRQLKIDLEASITTNNAANAGAAATARKSAGLETFAWEVNSHGTGSPVGSTTVVTAGAPTTAPVDAGTTRAFTETLLKAVILAGFNKGARYKMALLPFAQKQLMSTFAGVTGTRMNVEVGKKSMAGIIGAVDVYVSDNGAIMLTPDAHMRTRSVLLLDPEFVQVDFLQTYEHEELAKTGSATKHRVGANFTLAVKNPRGIGKIADLS